MKKFLVAILVLAMAFAITTPALAASFQSNITYDLTLTPAERAAIHAQVDALTGDVGDAVVGDGSYDPLSLVGTMLNGSSYDSISRGSGGTTATVYPFAVTNNATNQYEYDRKVAKLAWVVKVAKDLGFPVVVQRQPDKVVYVEIGDPDAPEMVMALSHLDSPTGSVSAAQLARWRGPDGTIGDPTAYKTPYIKDGWIYGAGMQDDSGPTLATLYAAKAMMEAGLPMDRRVRIVMGIYEDGGPGTPSIANTQNYMNIPYYTANPGFYDNWAYKMLNREEIPIAAYTSDSRFPVVLGTSNSVTTTSPAMDLAADAGKPFRLIEASYGVTLRTGDPTLKDIVFGSTTQVASRALFTLDVAGVSAADRSSFITSVNTTATARGWLPALAGEVPKVQAEISGDTILIEINTGLPMEPTTSWLGKNAVVWGMHLISEALGARGITSADLQLKKAADGIADLFFRGYEEGDAYIGKNMGLTELRHPDSGAPYWRFALLSNINWEGLRNFYTASSSTTLSLPLIMRREYTYAEEYTAAREKVTKAWEEKGFSLGSGFPTAFGGSTYYLAHSNPLIALQLASYRASMEHDPASFSDVYDFLDLAYAHGTDGGTLAGDYTNKMTAFGAVIAGNERWWHSANERMKIISAVQMTKMMADGMQEMARYTGPAGAQYMWADIPGLNADRADLDLLDVTIGTYQDASDAVLAEHLGADMLLAATEFDIPMWNARGNRPEKTAAAYEAGHGAGGVYLALDNADFLANTFVLPMRLEFKVVKPGDMTDADWAALADGGLEKFSFNLLNNGKVVSLTLPEGENADKFFFKRVSKYDPNTIYVSVNLAITDASYEGVETVIADSKTDLYSLNPAYEAANGNPFPERGAKEQRGFFLFGDGSKNARFMSPEAIYVTLAANTVVFLDWQGNVIDTQEVAYGEAAIAPTAPEREGYHFTGWDVDFSAVTDNLVVTAQYEINVYTVTFVDWDGDVLDEQQVEHGSAAIAPADPYRKDWIFTGWDMSFSTVTGDLTVTAQYDPTVINVTPTAFVTKLNGNKNDLTITVTELWSDGESVPITKTFSINNNAAGTYNVGSYKVYVDTKGNDQIRSCYLVE